jgi:hypothetical protein
MNEKNIYWHDTNKKIDKNSKKGFQGVSNIK